MRKQTNPSAALAGNEPVPSTSKQPESMYRRSQRGNTVDLTTGVHNPRATTYGQTRSLNSPDPRGPPFHGDRMNPNVTMRSSQKQTPPEKQEAAQEVPEKQNISAKQEVSVKEETQAKQGVSAKPEVSVKQEAPAKQQVSVKQEAPEKRKGLSRLRTISRLRNPSKMKGPSKQEEADKAKAMPAERPQQKQSLVRRPPSLVRRPPSTQPKQQLQRPQPPPQQNRPLPPEVQQQEQEQQQPTTPPPPSPPPTPPPPMPERRSEPQSKPMELVDFWDIPLDAESIIPVRQARPPLLHKRAYQPPQLPPAFNRPYAGVGNPLAPPDYGFHFLPEEEMLANTRILSPFVDIDTMEQLLLDRKQHEEQVHKNEELYGMVDSGVPLHLIERFLQKCNERQAASQREQEHYRKLEKMIAEENDDIDLVQTISRLQLNKRLLEPEATPLQGVETTSQKVKFRSSEQEEIDAIIAAIPEQDEPEDMLPELVAAMMYTEECGLGLTNPPSDIFTFLFGHHEHDEEEDEEDEEEEEQEMPQVRPSSPHQDAEVTFEGASRTPWWTLTPQPDNATDSPEPRIAQTVRRSLRKSRRPKRRKSFNLVQMCGSRPPFWFRGYLEAFPHSVGGMEISKSPSTTLQTAWYLSQPETYKDKSKFIVVPP